MKTLHTALLLLFTSVITPVMAGPVNQMDEKPNASSMYEEEATLSVVLTSTATNEVRTVPLCLPVSSIEKILRIKQIGNSVRVSVEDL